MLMVMGLGGAFGYRDLLAALDRRQAIVELAGDVSGAEHALAEALASADPGDAAPRIVRCGPDEATPRLVDLLTVDRPAPGRSVVLLEEAEAGALAILLVPYDPARPALACLDLAADAQRQAADLLDVGRFDDLAPAAFAALLAQCGTREDGEVLAVVAAHAKLPDGMPVLCGVAQLAAAQQGRRIPEAGVWPAPFNALAALVDADLGADRPLWSRYWPAPHNGPRTGLALLPGGAVIAVTAPPRRALDQLSGASVSPHAFTISAADAVALAARLADSDCAKPTHWQEPLRSAPCRAELLADDALSLARASAQLRERLDPAAPARHATDPISGSSFVTEPIGAAPVAFVFSGFGGGYPGMLRRLCDALPSLADHLEATFGSALRRVMPARTLYPRRASDPKPTLPLRGAPAEIAAAEFIGHAVYAWIAQDLLGLRPSAAIGLSLGGMAMAPALCGSPSRMAAIALGPGGLIEVAGRLAGNAAQQGDDIWSHWWVGGAAAELIGALQAFPALHLLVHCDDRLILIGGPRAEAARFIKDNRAAGGVANSGMRHLHTPMIAPAVDGLRDAMIASVIDMPRERLRGTDFYVSERPVRAGASSAAMDEFCRQAIASLSAPVDLPAMVRAAYRRGARVFVGCGCREDTTGWVGRCLSGLPHVAVPLGSAKLDPWRALLSAARLLRAHGALPAETELDKVMRVRG
jgi:hypothetical protein